MLLRNYLNNVSGKSKSDITSFEGGLNTCADKTFIRDNQMPYMWNVGIFDSPTLETRSNRMSIAWFMDDKELYAKGRVFSILPVSGSPTTKNVFYTIEYNPEVNDIPDDDEGGGGTPGHNPQTTGDDEGGTTPGHNPQTTGESGNSSGSEGTTPGHSPLTLLIASSNETSNVEFTPTTVLGIYKYRQIGNGIEKTYIGAIEYGTGTLSMEYWQGEVDTTGEGGYASQGEFVMASNGIKRVWFQGLAFDIDPEEAEYNVETTYPGILQMHKNRMFVAKQNILTFSNLNKPTDFDIDPDDPVNTAGQILIQNAKGKITAIQSFDDKLIIFCEHSRHILYGTSPNSEVDMYQLVDMDDDVGCISNKTICVCNRNLYWVANDFSIYRYNGASTYKISEPNGSDNYAQYGGVKGIEPSAFSSSEICMGAAGDLVYISFRYDITEGDTNDTALVYNTATRVWWAEDGAFSTYGKWERKNGNKDYLLGARYNGDIMIMNMNQKSGRDVLYDEISEDFYREDIHYTFETKTWNLGQIKHKKTLTNVWFQSNADAKVAVADYWSEYNPWSLEETDIDEDYLVLGKMKPINMRHNVQHPSFALHEGGERQRFIIPRMYMQKINTFSIRVDGIGHGYFYMMEKEWRIR